jgi:CRISPR/Cas system-associated endoribonuclease Cas2
MSQATLKHDWIILVHQLPPKPTNLRVRTWRKLQRLGAIAIKNSVYMLPFNDKTFEDFQWLKQEIESAGGEATVFRAVAVEGAANDEIVTSFRTARDEEYSFITAELNGVTGAVREQKRGGHLSVGRSKSYEADLDKLHKELERIISIDFFHASGRAAALAAHDRCRKALLVSKGRKRQDADSPSGKGAAIKLAQFQGCRWVTRKHLFIDRLAAIWLIKRFIDKRPRFSFVADGETVKGGIAFDMPGAEFTHEGEDCTFETMINRFGLGGDPGLRALAEIVHDMDLKDNKFNRLEVTGLNAIIRSLAGLLKDDRKLAEQGGLIFDGLYQLLSRDDDAIKETDSGKQPRNGDGKRRQRRGQGRP